MTQGRKYVVSNRAMTAVAKAIRGGYLQRLDGSVACVDCGEPARNYDHRDYSMPLMVEPVCVKCNLKRGPAVGVVRKSCFRPRKKLIQTRVDEREQRMVKAAAKASKRTVADWVRVVIVEAANGKGNGK